MTSKVFKIDNIKFDFTLVQASSISAMFKTITSNMWQRYQKNGPVTCLPSRTLYPDSADSKPISLCSYFLNLHVKQRSSKYQFRKFRKKKWNTQMTKMNHKSPRYIWLMYVQANKESLSILNIMYTKSSSRNSKFLKS